MDENLKSGEGTEVASHSGEDVIHSVDGENVDESIRKVKEDERNVVEEIIDVQQPHGEQLWKLDELLTLGKECLHQCSSEEIDFQEIKLLLVNYMGLICEHRNQLDSRLDLHAAIGDFASRFLYVLFHLEDYEECISWFETGISTEDALKESLEASGSVQYNVAISFLKRSVGKADLQRLQPDEVNHYCIQRGLHHFEKSCRLQVEDLNSLVFEKKNEVGFRAGLGVYVTIGRMLVVPGEMFEKLLGTPYSHFTYQQMIHLLDEVLVSVIGMKDEGLLVEAQAVLKMGVTFASKIEEEELRDRFLESIQKELRKSSKSSYQYQKAPTIDEVELRKALHSSTIDRNLKGGVGTDVASTSGDVHLQQPCGELDELLTLGKECLHQCTLAGSLEDHQEAKMLLVNYMGLICEHRNQLDSRLDLHAAIGDFASRFLYVLFHLEDYEECISWFETGISTEDALKESLEASGSVQYNVAISFLKRSVGNADLQRLQTEDVIPYLMERGMHYFEKSCQLQVEDFNSLVFEMKNEAGFRVDSGLFVTMGRIELVPREMFEKLLGTPYSHLTYQQADHLLDEVLASTTEMKDKGWLVEVEAVLKMGVTFASRIEDEKLRDHFLESVQMALRKLYDFRGQYEKAAEMLDKMLIFSQKIPIFRERLVRECMRAETWSLAGDHNRAIEIISTACHAVDAGRAPGVPFLYEDWKLEAHLKFTYGRVLGRAGRVDEAIKLMEKAKDLCLSCDYNGDDYGVNIGLCQFLQFYGQDDEYIESAFSLMDLIDPIMSKHECRQDFIESWLKEKGLIKHRIYDRDDADKCWTDAESVRLDSLSNDSGKDNESGNDDDTENEDKPDDLYKKYSHSWCRQCERRHLVDPMSHFQTFFYFAKCRWKSLETAVVAVNAAELVVHRRLDGSPSRLVDVHMLRGSLFFEHRKRYDGAVEVYEKAVEVLQKMNQANNEVKRRLSICYGMQARVKLERRSLDDGLELIHKAAPVLEKENPGVYYFLQAMALRLQNQSEGAETLGEMAFKELIKTQQSKPFQTQMAESAWIRTFEESTLLDVLQFNEMTSYWYMRSNRDALIWAERSRTRLYMRRTEDQPSVVSSTCELFDFHYEHAEELLGDAVLMCGRETAIISYSYCHLTNFLFCYLVFEGENRCVRVHCQPVLVPEELDKLWPSQSEPTLELLVDKAVNAIKDTDPRKKSRKDSIENRRRVSTKNAKTLLSILHSILIKPILINSTFFEPVVEQLRNCCKNLVISPQGFLSKVPFGALYDEAQGEFLIQQKTVCVIPSIRSLHRCFQRQAEFEKGWKDLQPPFVAGNPEPMGYKKLNLLQLQGAALEAERVAKILDGAQLFSGKKMTKAAVLQGLGRSQVVVLSTHGIINSYYPQGALVLCEKLDASPSSSSSEAETLTPAAKLAAMETNRRLDETLSPADIVKMPGTISAGLVVLSACESGLGKITQAEGVLGLGRAVLQEGGATTVLSLWKVDDSATTDLITGMFENLRKGWTVPQSLQASMMEMINDEKILYEWAPLIVMGSPKLRLPKYSSTSFDFISTITPDPSETLPV